MTVSDPTVLAVFAAPLVAAAVLFAIAVGVFLFLSRQRRWGQLLTTSANLLAWLLAALAAVLVIYAFFPESDAKGTVLGIQIGGGLAAVVVIWLLGTRSARQAIDVDAVRGERDAAQAEVDRLHTLGPADPAPDQGREIPRFERHEFTVDGARGKRIVLVTGDLRNAKRCADVWVASENTHMQLARYFDRAVSGKIRYLGARKAAVGGEVVEDTIGEELAAAMAGAGPTVQPASVIPTGPGALAETHGVKRVYHVAAVQGQPGEGYQPVMNLGQCITASLEVADSAGERAHDLHTVLFPLMGTGTARGKREELVGPLVSAAVNYLTGTPDTKIKTVLFLAWTDVDLALCQGACQADGRLQPKE